MCPLAGPLSSLALAGLSWLISPRHSTIANSKISYISMPLHEQPNDIRGPSSRAFGQHPALNRGILPWFGSMSPIRFGLTRAARLESCALVVRDRVLQAAVACVVAPVVAGSCASPVDGVERSPMVDRLVTLFGGTEGRSRHLGRSRMDLEQTLCNYLDWLKDTRTMSEHTLRAYGTDLRALVDHLGAGTPAESVSSEGLVRFIVLQRRRGLAPATIRRRASAISGFCGWLTRIDAVADNPWRDVDISIRQPKRLPRPARGESVRRLLASLCRSADISATTVPAGPFQRPYEANTLVAVALMVGTGLRVGEVVALRCHDLDPDSRSVRVIGKGSRERQVYLSGDWIVGLIRAQVKTRRSLGIRHQCLLFNRSGGTMTTAALRTRVCRELKLAGIDEHITPHVLRHTAATQLIDAGVDIRFVQRLLGHASLTTTEQYTRVSDTSLRRVLAHADTLGRLLAPHQNG